MISRVRWGLALLLVVIGLGTGVWALDAYLSHGLVLGVAAVLVLMGMAVVGMGSLALARFRLGAELTKLQETTPGGVMFDTRKEAAVAGGPGASAGFGGLGRCERRRGSGSGVLWSVSCGDDHPGRAGRDVCRFDGNPQGVGAHGNWTGS